MSRLVSINIANCICESRFATEWSVRFDWVFSCFWSGKDFRKNFHRATRDPMICRSYLHLITKKEHQSEILFHEESARLVERLPFPRQRWSLCHVTCACSGLTSKKCDFTIHTHWRCMQIFLVPNFLRLTGREAIDEKTTHRFTTTIHQILR